MERGGRGKWRTCRSQKPLLSNRLRRQSVCRASGHAPNQQVCLLRGAEDDVGALIAEEEVMWGNPLQQFQSTREFFGAGLTAEVPPPGPLRVHDGGDGKAELPGEGEREASVALV